VLKSLYIKNYALIKDIQLPFRSSFSTITGETGAGKSILLGALSLLLGSRADKDSLRDPKQKCIIEAEFDLSNFDLKAIFESYDLDYDSHSIIRREITASKTRAFINDTPVKLKTLQDLKPNLIDIHSQNESQSLAQSNYQYHVLDKIAKHDNLLSQYRNNLKIFKTLRLKIENLKKEKQEALKQQDYNQFLFDELEKSNLFEGKQDKLEEDFQTLQSAEDIQLMLSESIEIIQQEDHGIYDQLAAVNKRLSKIAQTLSSYQGLKERLQSILIESEDIGIELEHRLSDVEVNPEKLEEVETQLQNLNALLKKHQVQTDVELIEIKKELEQDLVDFSNIDQQIQFSERELEQAEKNLQELSSTLKENRKLSATKIEKELLNVLSNLGMQNASINIEVKDADDYHNFGRDQLIWLFSANKGLPLKPLSKVASGGEISRIMLAIKSTLARYENLPTIIFDEIDTGVSGEIALKMGDIMKTMSQKMQVISITHLPQIASKGEQHLKVLKDVSKTTTETQIKELNNEDRVLELSQMLGGDKNSSSAIAHAKSLLN
jgi:DNA repair protein RecN (Recombination protein N)